jgi:tetratricopeptide (TPR) repeat protein
MAHLLARYEFGALSDEERKAFEAHVLECDSCFAELERGSIAVAALRDRALEWRAALRGEPAGARRAAPSVGERLRALLGRLPSPRLLVPALAVLLAAVVVTVRLAGPPGFTRLATFPTEDVASGVVRGPAADDAVRELMDAGAGYFDLGRYDEAAVRFRAALARDPQAADAAYLLGLCDALSGRVREAIPTLENAARLAGGDLRPKATWVLANAYLKAGRLDDARRTLESLSAGEGESAAAARDLLARLPR